MLNKGMSEKNPTSADSRVQDAIYELISDLLQEGASPAEISYHLTLHALNMGIQLAPSVHHAYSVIASAILHTTQHHAGVDAEEGSDPIEAAPALKKKESSIIVPFEPRDKTVH
ncbi:hypothetical protein ACFL0N_01375 [Pseudomonadota bacterium]